MTAPPVVAVTVFGLAVTSGAYVLSLWARRHYPSPLTTPVLFSTIVVIAILLGTGISFAEYGPAKQIMTFLLGPATVALALPIYKNRRVFFKNIVPAGCGLLAGSLGTMIVAGLTARIFGLTSLLTASIAIKSATTPIAIEIAVIVHGAPALTAIFVVTTGMLGASLGPWLMDRAGITHPVSRGLALGTISHGQGTAEAVVEGQLPGAVSGVAMGLGAVCTALTAPWIVPLLAG